MNHSPSPSQQVVSVRLIVTVITTRPLPFGTSDFVELNGTFFRVNHITAENESEAPHTKAITLSLDWVPRDAMVDGTDVFSLRWANDEISTLVH